MITDDQIRALNSFSHVKIDGREHFIGNVTYDEDYVTHEIIRASVFSVTDQVWLILRAPKRAFNDPRVDCCGRDAADCDCYPHELRYVDHNMELPKPVNEEEHEKSCDGCSYCKPHPGSSPRP